MSVQDEVKKSRLTLRYKTEVDGEPAVVDLPFRLMILGNFSGGSSKDRKVDLDERKLRSLSGNNMGDLMKDMDIKLDMVVPNKIDPEEESLRVKLPIDSINSFSPKDVAHNIPQINSLLMLKKLLEELQSNIANKKELAQLMSKLISSPEAFNKIKEKLQSHAMFQIPQKKETANGNS